MTGVRSIEAVAAGLTAALSVGDLDQLAPLLAADVRWGGDEDSEQTCHSRAVVLVMAVQWPQGWDSQDDRRSTQAQVFRVRDGFVVDIRDDVDHDHLDNH